MSLLFNIHLCLRKVINNTIRCPCLALISVDSKRFQKYIFYGRKIGIRLCHSSLSPPWRILFFGNDEFSLTSLKLLFEELKCGKFVSQVDVVTTGNPKTNPVSLFASKNHLQSHEWPVTVPEGEYDVGLVVSFGKLIPERIISLFPLGMLNVHASLLPRWRGAAPIIYAVLHGDSETGISIMQIRPHKFDVGCVVRQAECSIGADETALELSLRLARLGSRLLLESVRELPRCLHSARPQPLTGITHAPRVTPVLARIDWTEMGAREVYNLQRALQGLHALTTRWRGVTVKLFRVTNPTPPKVAADHIAPGTVDLDRGNGTLTVVCRDGHLVRVTMVGVPGKKAMSALQFYNGYISKVDPPFRMFH